MGVTIEPRHWEEIVREEVELAIEASYQRALRALDVEVIHARRLARRHLPRAARRAGPRIASPAAAASGAARPGAAGAVRPVNGERRGLGVSVRTIEDNFNVNAMLARMQIGVVILRSHNRAQHELHVAVTRANRSLGAIFRELRRCPT